MTSNKNILITGGAGSIGRILVQRLLKQDPNVIRILDQSEPDLSAFNMSVDMTDVDFLREASATRTDSL